METFTFSDAALIREILNFHTFTRRSYVQCTQVGIAAILISYF